MSVYQHHGVQQSSARDAARAFIFANYILYSSHILFAVNSLWKRKGELENERSKAFSSAPGCVQSLRVCWTRVSVPGIHGSIQSSNKMKKVLRRRVGWKCVAAECEKVALTERTIILRTKERIRIFWMVCEANNCSGTDTHIQIHSNVHIHKPA